LQDILIDYGQANDYYKYEARVYGKRESRVISGGNVRRGESMHTLQPYGPNPVSPEY